MSSPLRPTAYSENDVNMIRLHEPLVLPLVLPLAAPSQSPSSSAHEYALRFSIHLALISLFETLFFWKFVSKTEDAALVNLITDYTSGLMTACSDMSVSQRAALREWIDHAINPANISAAAAAAAAQRDTINTALVQKSWLYFGGLATVVAGLSGWGHFRGYKMNWSGLVAENIALVTMLGLYECMYFSTVILQYQAISMPELDRMVMDNFQATC